MNALRRRETVAVLGGAFDPVHCGHIHLARRALRELPVNAVRLIPNGEPPHRPPPLLDWRKRCALCRIAAAGEKAVTVGEDEPPGKRRRTVATLRKLRRRARPVLLLGADAFRGFRKWKEWRALLRLAPVVVARRKGSPPARRAVPPQWIAKARARPKKLWRGALFWNPRAPEISSTQLRNSGKKR